MASWVKDDGYCGCKTARFGNLAVVICPPELGEGWGYQVFDEDNDEAIESGEFEHAGYGFKNEAAVIEFAERVYA